MQKRLSLCLVALSIAGAACVPPKLGNDKEVDYDLITVMGRIQERGFLKVAIPSDRPPFGPRKEPPESSKLNLDGFDLALAEEVAGALGVKLDIRKAPNDQLLSMVQPPQIPDQKTDEIPPEDPEKVDIAFPLVPITENAVKQRRWSYTNPYFIGHQRLLVPADSGIEEAADLSGEWVCQVRHPVTDLDISTIVPDAMPIEPITSGCPPLLENERATAATASDALLGGWKLQLQGDWAITGAELTTVGYGAVVQAAATSWRDYVNAQFAEFKAEGRWLEAYGKYLEEVFGPPPLETPSMTTEEAAAIYPADPES